MAELSEVFWTFLISSVCGILLVGIRLCYKSKCKEVNLCCLKIIRDVETEEKEMEMMMRQPPTPQNADNSTK
jgi:hypothetical protein